MKITLALFLAEHLSVAGCILFFNFNLRYMQFSKIFLNLDASIQWLNRPCRLSESSKSAFVRIKKYIQCELVILKCLFYLFHFSYCLLKLHNSHGQGKLVVDDPTGMILSYHRPRRALSVFSTWSRQHNELLVMVLAYTLYVTYNTINVFRETSTISCSFIFNIYL